MDILGDRLFNKVNKNNINNIKLHGNLQRDEVRKFINKSKFLIFPSEWYESFPMTILEAFREGTLVMASNIGSVKSIIKDKYNGILFEPGNHKDLINKVEWILNNPKICDQIALNANNEFYKKYSSEINYKQLIQIYQEQFTKMRTKIISYFINDISLNNLLKKILYWSKYNRSHYICVSNVHSCIESFWNNDFKIAHNSANIAIPDGRPIFGL